MNRIVSLLPSATEIVAALGAQDKIVGLSHECDFPAGVANLPICTRPHLDSEASSQAIDQAVKASIKNALAIYEVLTENLRTLAPDIVVTQDQCDVCAVALADVEAELAEWTGQNVTLVTLHPTDLDAVLGDIRRVGAMIGCAEKAEIQIQRMLARRNSIAEKVAQLETPTVACIEWTDPLMAAGNWVPELVSLAGGRDIFGTVGAHAPWIDWETFRDSNPDVIVFMPCGFDLTRCRKEAVLCANRPGWQSLKAVKSNQVYVTDGNSYFNRPGPRLAESLEIMAEILHPESFEFGHWIEKGGDGWARFDN